MFILLFNCSEITRILFYDFTDTKVRDTLFCDQIVEDSSVGRGIIPKMFASLCRCASLPLYIGHR
uniref:Uncharacterized protein n=1 Tax=Arion vulgaris TaxID=1028688 RepID=A0A0B7BW44_9EUPU